MRRRGRREQRLTRGKVGEVDFPNVRVGRLERQTMRETLGSIRSINVLHEILVVARDLTFTEEFVHSRIGNRVVITTDDGRDLASIGVGRRLVVSFSQIEARWKLGEIIGNLAQLVHEHGDLNQLDVAELVVPSEMGVGDDEASSRFAVLQQSNDSDVVLGHDPVEHVLRLFEIGTAHGDLVELDELLLDEGEAGGGEKSGVERVKEREVEWRSVKSNGKGSERQSKDQRPPSSPTSPASAPSFPT